MGKVVDCLAERLRSANKQVHPLMSGDATYHVLQQLRYIYTCYGRPKVDGYTEMLTVVVATQPAIREVSTALCISKDRIALVISRLLETNLIKPFGSDGFLIPNMELFQEFTNYCRIQQGVARGFDEASDTSVFVSEGEYVIRQIVGDGGGELQPVKAYPEERVIGTDDPAAKQEKFGRILARLRSVQEAPVSSSVVAQRSRDANGD
jgi:hypothetical protein